MARYKLIALLLMVPLLFGWDHGNSIGVQASRAKAFTNSVGMGDPNNVAGATVESAFAYMGIVTARSNVPQPGDGGSNYNYLANLGVHMNFLWANDSLTTDCANIASSIATTFALIDTFVATYPGMMLANEGPNETNNFPVCYLNTAVTNGATALGNAVLHFAAVPADLVTAANATYTDSGTIQVGAGFTVTDVTTPAAIPSSTTIVSATSTSVTLSANATSGGVLNGDTIQFEAIGVEPSTNVPVTASSLGWQAAIYNATHADSHLTGVIVANYTGFVPGATPNPPSLASTADYNNIHWYPGNGSQSTPWSGASSFAAALNPINQPITTLLTVATETGWCTPSAQSGAVDQTTQAILLLNNYLDFFSGGTPYTLVYTLFDGNTGDSSCFDNYGVFESDQATPKTAATAIKNMQTVLNDSGGTALTFTPGKLNYAITGLATGGSGGFSQLLEKSNGTFEITVWNEPQIWNDTTHAEITPPTSTIGVTFGRTCTTANVYDLMTGTSPISTSSNVSSLSSLSLIKDPLVIECIP